MAQFFFISVCKRVEAILQLSPDCTKFYPNFIFQSELYYIKPIKQSTMKGFLIMVVAVVIGAILAKKVATAIGW